MGRPSPVPALAPSLRFEAAEHEYYLDGVLIPSVTQMLLATGHIKPRYYSDDGRERGAAVHRLTAAYDRGTLDLDAVKDHRGYVLAYVEAMRQIRPVWAQIEEMAVHPGYPFAGTPDRVGQVFGVWTIPEIKTGGREKWHAIQTALQAILISVSSGPGGGLPPQSYQRATIYLKPSGRPSLEHHPDRHDLDRAYDVLKDCCRGGYS